MRCRPDFVVALLLALALPAMSACAGPRTTEARRDVQAFILETLRKQEGEAWQRVGQYLLWSYRFDTAGCELEVGRESDLGDLFTQRIPMASATVVATQNSELVFDCRQATPCVDYRIKNPQNIDEQRVARTRLLVMDDADLTPLMNAFAELHQLCRDPYSPVRRR